MGQSEPFILLSGQVGTSNAQYFICIEKALALEVKTLRDALMDIIASYYVFDIMYPKQFAGIFLFFQQSVFGVKAAQKPRPCFVKLLQNLDNK